ncbi:MAG: hypothetical protein K0Q55_137 [Verrucomicrobia bacterium]|jgi:hypothetical protein|nr:hypothetical protein [Verrucomicrobiota bacterium]
MINQTKANHNHHARFRTIKLDGFLPQMSHLTRWKAARGKVV